VEIDQRPSWQSVGVLAGHLELAITLAGAPGRGRRGRARQARRTSLGNPPRRSHHGEASRVSPRCNRRDTFYACLFSWPLRRFSEGLRRKEERDAAVLKLDALQWINPEQIVYAEDHPAWEQPTIDVTMTALQSSPPGE